MAEKVVIRERRRGRRVKKSVECAILTEDSSSDLKGLTKNLSCVGASCKVNKAIPEMTRLRLSLELDSGIQKFEGIIVRCDKIDENQFDAAIYFTNIDLEARRKIDEFVNRKEPSKQQDFRIDD